jgi:hypothetical protein
MQATFESSAFDQEFPVDMESEPKNALLEFFMSQLNPLYTFGNLIFF